MKLSRQCEIALDILVACAGNNGPVVKTKDAASSAVATKDHTSIIVSRLVRAGFLRSERGSKGGVYLARPANSIFVGDIVRTFPSAALSASCRTSNEKMRQVVVQVENSVFQILDSFTISDLIGRQSFHVPPIATDATNGIVAI